MVGCSGEPPITPCSTSVSLTVLALIVWVKERSRIPEKR
jgi:hypothetical protein